MREAITEAPSEVPQAGLAFLRDIALETDVEIRDMRTPEFHRGETVVERVGATGVHVCEFVISPGPEAKLVVIAKQPGERHPLVGIIHELARYREHPRSVDPHRHKFATSGRPLRQDEAVVAIAHLAQLAS